MRKPSRSIIVNLREVAAVTKAVLRPRRAPKKQRNRGEQRSPIACWNAAEGGGPGKGAQPPPPTAQSPVRPPRPRVPCWVRLPISCSQSERKRRSYFLVSKVACCPGPRERNVPRPQWDVHVLTCDSTCGKHAALSVTPKKPSLRLATLGSWGASAPRVSPILSCSGK